MLKEIKKNLDIERYLLIKKMLSNCDELGIKHEVVYKSPGRYYFKFTKGKKSVFVVNMVLGRVVDTMITTVTDSKNFVRTILKKLKIKTPSGFMAINLNQIKKQLKAGKIKFPLVIKPEFANKGVGVVANIKNMAGLEQSLKEIMPKGWKKQQIIVEEYYRGHDYRLLYLDGKLIACSERTYPQVVGDGKSSIQELIKKQISSKTIKFKIDWETKRILKDEKLTLKSVLKEGKKIRLKEKANMSTGGFSINRTGEVANKFIKIGKQCVDEFGINFGGVDIMSSDISDPKADYRIIEINANPEFFLHEYPIEGKSDEVIMKLLKYIFKI